MILRLFAVSIAVILLGCSTVSGPTPLFNGKDTRGWVLMHGGEWEVSDGVLVGKNGTNWTTNPEKSGSWLRTARQYDNFVLELEYAINQRGNSGIFFRSDLAKNPAFTGYEMQIVDDHGRKPTKGSTGGLYDVVAATKNMSRPAGEWNQVKISAQGQHIQIWLNGEQVVNFQGTRATNGYIGLQAHDRHSVVKFRNIRITEL